MLISLNVRTYLPVNGKLCHKSYILTLSVFCVAGVEHSELVSLADKYFGNISLTHEHEIPEFKRCRFTGSEVITDCFTCMSSFGVMVGGLYAICLRMLLGIKWYQFVRNDDVRRLTNQPKLTAIIQSCRLTLFGHIMRMDDNADAKRILLASLPADWRRQLGRPRITWLSTIQQDLKQHLTLPEAADLAQNRPLWRMMSTYGATQS